MQNPFLLHLFIVVAMMHDAFLDPSLNTPASRATLALHLYHATSLFKQKLLKSSSEQACEVDSLWLACSLMSITSFGKLDIMDPFQAWPLKDSNDGCDLEWLGMSDGKRALTNMSLASPDGSFFKDLLHVLSQHHPTDGEAPIAPDVLPAGFYPLFNLSQDSSSEINPYHKAASILGQLFHRRVDEFNIGDFLAFTFYADRSYRDLLQAKDHRSLLLMSYWFAMIATNSVWWMQRRPAVEGAAICIYLERNCVDRRILDLLDYPRTVLLPEPCYLGSQAPAPSISGPESFIS